MEDFIGQIFHQNCGDNLKVLKKTEEKKDGKYLYLCKFLKYPCEVLVLKQQILRGTVLNPQIEQVEFIDKIWPQHCGDDLKIIRKTDIKKNNTYLWECEFIKYPYKILTYKDVIIRGSVVNPQIEIEEFVKKEWPQNCGDTLKILEKVYIEDRKKFLFKCIFKKYPCEVIADKTIIMKGQINNPLIKYQIVGKEFSQNCGDILKIKDIIGEGGNVIGEFLKYPCEIVATKSHVLSGSVDNPSLPWKTKENLYNYIQEHFKNIKPTLTELKNSLNISLSFCSKIIIENELQDYINYNYVEEENYLYNFLKDNSNIKIEKSNCKLLGGGKEIDIYIPSLKIGIEYNGNYWHSNIYRSNNYHQEKSLLAQEKGIKLIHIWEWELKNNEEVFKSFLLDILNTKKKKLYARSCNIRELNNKEYSDFCNNNHLQGEAGAKVKLGLFYKDELIQIMSFGVPRFTDKYEWEIIRECSKLGYIIIGGKEKLWSYFIRNYNPENCISYCDFSKFTGESYLKLGFKKERLNKPGFVWYDNNTKQIFWRNPYKNKEMKQKEYLKLFDAGQLVFTWSR